MKCRITIKGRKIWRDGNNVAGKRPPSVEITLFRDNAAYKEPVIVDSDGDGAYVFYCLPVQINPGHKYRYRVDELDVPAGYKKTIEGFNVINTIDPGSIAITGTKTWVDNNNAGNKRPDKININLFQNGLQIRSISLDKPPVGENTANFSFDNVPQFDSEGSPFKYTVDENDIAGYSKSITGYNITNTLL